MTDKQRDAFAERLTAERALAPLCVGGIDEVGRGPLAGPVVAACVVLDHGRDLAALWQVRDSKKLSRARREALVPLIQEHALAWGIGSADVAEIARLNILQAALLAMRRAVAACDPAPAHLLIDGNQPLAGLALPQDCVVGGDDRVLCIAAASVLAKVHRDGLMAQLDADYPGYDFTRHSGYGTPAHLAALRSLGPCPAHRLGFLTRILPS